MSDLDWKYRHNKLSPEELEEYRKEIDSANDDTLASNMNYVWQNEILQEDKAYDKCLHSIKKRIDIVRYGRNKVMKTAVAIAACLIPVLIFMSYYLFFQTKHTDPCSTIIATRHKDKAFITLPDSTHVTIAENSKIQYDINDFSKKSRHMNIDGEAYFDVVKDLTRPFTISSKYIVVKVTGTKFNLQAWAKGKQAEITMEDGTVILTSLITNKNVYISRGQKAVVNYTTGSINVSRISDMANIATYHTGTLAYAGANISKIAKDIEKVYKTEVKVKNINTSKHTFTGTLPADDLLLAVRIISEAYGINYIIRADKVILYK